jgi:hypothetical protein
MEQCLLCDPNSVARGNEAAPICAAHQQQARAAFESAEPVLRAHLEQVYAGELDGWVRKSVLPGLTWHLLTRDDPPAPKPDHPWRPGRLTKFGRDPDGFVRILREVVVRALEQKMLPNETAVVIRVGTPDGRSTAGVDAVTTANAMRCLIAELITVERVEAALRGLETEAAARAVIDATVEGQRESEELVAALGALSLGAQTFAQPCPSQPDSGLNCWRVAFPEHAALSRRLLTS